MPRALAALACCLALAGCLDMPELVQPATPPAGPPPRILPLDSLLAGVPPEAPAALPPLAARAAALRARAAALRATPMTPPRTE